MTAADTIAPVHEPSARSNAAYAIAVDISSVASGLAAREWRPAPGELVSLWDMLRFSAHAFMNLMQVLGRGGTCLQVTTQWKAHPDSPPPPGVAELRAELASQGMSDDLDALHAFLQNEWQKLRGVLTPVLDEIEKACAVMQLDSGLAKVGRMRHEIESLVAGPDIAVFLQRHFKDLRERIEDQLKSRLFVFIPQDRA